MSHHPHPLLRPIAVIAMTHLLLVACGSGDTDHGAAKAPASNAQQPTNRIDIPDAVRRNLGMTFAKVERRQVERLLRVPGRFEALPSARREYRAPLEGTVELLVREHQSVDAGTPLYRLHSPDWRQLREDVASARARMESFAPIQAANVELEKRLQAQCRLWAERVDKLERILQAGGGGASQIASARAELGAAESALFELKSRMAEATSDQRAAESSLRSLEARTAHLLSAAACTTTNASDPDGSSLTVCAATPGKVQALHATEGGRVEPLGPVLNVVDPTRLRFRGAALQSDLGRLRDGAPARVAAATAEGASTNAPMRGKVEIAPIADAERRTIDLILVPDAVAAWARPGVAATLEVPLEESREELAIPLQAVSRDGANPIIFRRDPSNADRAIRLDADLGASDGRWIEILSGVAEGDEVVVAGSHQLMLATSGTAAKGGHFHPDGSFHEGDN